MKDFLKDSKNAPYVIIVFIVLGMGLIDRSLDSAFVLLLLMYGLFLVYSFVKDMKNKIK